MKGAKRRERIAALLDSRHPITGTELAKQLGVSRQIIVQDIALMRAEDKSILSTNKGYLLYDSSDYENSCRRVFHVHHTTDQVLEELLTIAELGGRVLDVSVEHELYGQIRVDLFINCPQDAVDFADKLRRSNGTPLKALTDDHHYHTVVAASERLLDLIEAELLTKGFLISED